MSCPITGDPECKCNEVVIVLQKNLNIKEVLRKLFTEHAFYTRFFVDSFGLSENEPLTTRLLKNQEDIGNALGKVPNDLAKGKELTELLKAHIMAAAGAVTALNKNGPDSNELKEAIKKVFENSTLVAQFLSKLSPKLPFDVVKKEFDTHNQHVLNIATFHYKKDYNAEIKEADIYYNHMLRFSDLLAKALEQPLPEGQKGGDCGEDYYRKKYRKYKIKYLSVL
jgi:hypothetical protein